MLSRNLAYIVRYIVVRDVPVEAFQLIGVALNRAVRLALHLAGQQESFNRLLNARRH